MKALITGIYGFVGVHLAGYLLGQNYHVAGFCLESDIDEKALPSDVEIFTGDLRDQNEIARVVDGYKPDAVIHLAAVSSVKFSFENPAETFAVNILGTLNLLEAISRLNKSAKTLLISSSEIYGQLNIKDTPVEETAILAPVNPYGVSKAAVDLLGYQYFISYGMPVYRIRAFSHSGPRQSIQAVLSDWAFQTAKVELGLAPPEIKVGNLKVIRDYMDVRDVVRAYLAILEKGQPGEAYNVCSGNRYELGKLLNLIISFCSKPIKIIRDPSRFRPVDIPVLVGSPEKLKAATGWKPQIEIDTTLKDLYSYWLEHLRRQAK
jgi:GDP-4-dehydro-6-deoxy-D-mannose reductase